MNSWRITKYNPSFRDEHGAYLKDEWTSVSDVGKSFDGELLTFDKYREVEDAHVSTALSLVSEAGLAALTVMYLEAHNVDTAKAKDLLGITFDPKLVRTGMELSGEALSDLCRLVLREVLWCKLESANGFYLHFGYDYYLYVGSPASSERSVAYGKRAGLYVEKMESPYLAVAEA
jgi:hypothetical protein